MSVEYVSSILETRHTPNQRPMEMQLRPPIAFQTLGIRGIPWALELRFITGIDIHFDEFIIVVCAAFLHRILRHVVDACLSTSVLPHCANVQLLGFHDSSSLVATG